MKYTTFEEIRTKFKEFNKEHNINYGDYGKNIPMISAVIVYKQSNFTAPYTEKERSYRINNLCGKAFFNTISGSQSMRGDSLDGSDLGVRLDCYNWDIEYCYFES